MGMNLTEREVKNKNLLSEKKPIAFNKIKTFSQRVKEEKSIALIQLQISYQCPLKCKHCAVEKFKQHIKEDMSIENIKKIADEAHEYGISAICISGGEPLAFPNLNEIIDAIGPDRFVLSMDTNGLYLTEEKIKWLVEKGVNRIHLSMDGTELNHEQFRNSSGLWKKCVNALEYTKKYGLGVVINIVITKDLINSGELIKQLEYLKQFNEHASLIYAKNVGAFEGAKDQILNTDDLNYLESLTKKYNCSTHLTPNNGMDLGCLCIKRHLSILPNGILTPCPWIPISMGNVIEEGLVTVIERSLKNKWFSFKQKHSCLCGNEDSFFYQNIIPQIEKFDEYPVSSSKIDWHLEYFEK
jgi:MoaA/NifB/PqqE/SkfB family radical SAM enzyme